MTPPKSEKTVLRTELRRVWSVVEILLGVLAGSVRMTGNVLKVIIDEMAQLSEENIVLRETTKTMEQRIRIHESWNHSPAEATEYARNRRQFRKDAKEHKAKEAQAPHDQMQRKAGHQQGMPGVSPTTVLLMVRKSLQQICADSAGERILSLMPPYKK